MRSPARGPQMPLDALPRSYSDGHFSVNLSVKDECGLKQFWRRGELCSLSPKGNIRCPFRWLAEALFWKARGQRWPEHHGYCFGLQMACWSDEARPVEAAFGARPEHSRVHACPSLCAPHLSLVLGCCQSDDGWWQELTSLRWSSWENSR